ncbi:hypothetical protein [uncultured Sulfitobacter sp.]|uniref:hypothetical protein n=1 Tax=uncultured Sulfitobacter sp. TaxID=191468 RepID=UPI0026044C3D|nr:hypothetical protein [uncultured Sulfitobacter sp.]
MTISHPKPQPNGSARRQYSQQQRASAAVQANARPLLPTTANGEEAAHTDSWPFQFTKGLPHDARGFVAPEAYRQFVHAINAPSPYSSTAPFDVPLGPRDALGALPPERDFDDTGLQHTFHCTGPEGTPLHVRNWESPRSGHVADLQGADADDLPMPPAPSAGTDELTAEMAEVYGLALLRDVPFTAIRNSDQTPGAAGSSPESVQAALNQLPWFRPEEPVTGIFADIGEPLSEPEKARRAARLRGRSALDGHSIFRGSAPGSMTGPYISQFMLAGTTKNPMDGFIKYGVQTISQKIATFKPRLDYMGDWHSWLDVQNGANPRRLQELGGYAECLEEMPPSELPPRFIATPRDLASYVRIDALYQAYLNAALMLLGKATFDTGMPSGKKDSQRGSFATFGDPHLLALLTEVSSRGLKLVRRQKFNYHRRARPERLGAMLTLVANNDLDGLPACARQNLIRMHGELHHTGLLDQINAHNMQQLSHAGNPLENRGNIGERSLLLPMAFIEGSPMHPAYGAGHATVAGACVTILKAFFQMFKSESSWEPLTLADIGMDMIYEAEDDGSALRDSGDLASEITVEGELNKLAANISIGRNMAGVHYYSDYHDSLRLGERLAVSILEEQMFTYPEPWDMRLHGFDGEQITIRNMATAGGLKPQVDIAGQDYREWLGIGTHRVAHAYV